jgi:hypothetical protein
LNAKRRPREYLAARYALRSLKREQIESRYVFVTERRAPLTIVSRVATTMAFGRDTPSSGR